MSEPETDARKALIHRLDEGGYEWEEVHALIDDIEAELRAKLAAGIRAMPGLDLNVEKEVADLDPDHWLEAFEERDSMARITVASDGALLVRGRVLRLIEGSDPAGRSWPGRAEMEAMTDAEVNDFLESRGLDVRVIEGSDPASPEAAPFPRGTNAYTGLGLDQDVIRDPASRSEYRKGWEAGAEFARTHREGSSRTPLADAAAKGLASLQSRRR